MRRRKTHGMRKTWHKTPRPSQKVSQTHKGLLSNKKQALPIRTGSSESRRSLCQARPPRKKTRISQTLDPAHRRSRPQQRPNLRTANPRPESRRRLARSQNPGRYRAQRRRRFLKPGSQRQSSRSAPSQKGLGTETSLRARLAACPDPVLHFALVFFQPGVFFFFVGA